MQYVYIYIYIYIQQEEDTITDAYAIACTCSINMRICMCNAITCAIACICTCAIACIYVQYINMRMQQEEVATILPSQPRVKKDPAADHHDARVRRQLLRGARCLQAIMHASAQHDDEQ